MIFTHPTSIIQLLKQHGYEAYFVGGAVRDIIIGREAGDIDIATSATPDEVKELFPHTLEIGIEHGTVVVMKDKIPYEVTTFRSESEYSDFRRPNSVKFIRSLHEDLQRRDFTMNAIAMTEDGKRIDLFNGELAIKKKIIETVGNAKERFSEDALRMLRAIRFASQLHFTLAESTKKAIIKNGSLLSHVSVERITMEIEKIFASAYAKVGFQLISETNICDHFPTFQQKELFHKLTQLNWGALQTNSERWAVLVCLENQSLKTWKLPKKIIKETQMIKEWLTKVSVFKDWTLLHLYDSDINLAVSIERVRSVLSGEDVKKNVAYVEQKIKELPIKSRHELAINGDMLMAFRNKEAGSWIKTELRLIEEAVVMKVVANEIEEIKGWLQWTHEESY